MVTRTQLTSDWILAANSGTLLTTKHDPNAAAPANVSFRSVVTQEVSGSLKAFVAANHFAVNHYEDSRYRSGAGFFEVIPDASSGLDVGNLGILSGSTAPRIVADRLVFVSGSNAGWHVYAENQSTIAAFQANGRLKLIGAL